MPQRGKSLVKISVRAEWRPVFTLSTNGDEHESVHKVADEGSLLDTDFQDGGISDTDSDWV